MGFQYGGLVNMFHYGDGTIYPEYKHQVKMEISRYTRGSGVNQLFYDSKYLLPNKIRFTADLSYFTEKALDFYGFNGYRSVYEPKWADEEDPAYVSRMFYRLDRKLFRFTADLQGRLHGEHLRWLAGLAVMNMKIGSVDTADFNKKLDADKKLPYAELLYDKYVKWGLLSKEEADGGNTNFLKFGLVYDTRDNEANAMKGVWTEALMVYSPEFFANESSFAKLVLIHREYFTLVPKKLSLVYRIGYQGTIGGDVPFYFQPYMLSSFSTVTKTDGLGGAKNLRGIMRDRVVGDGVAYGNLELRWKFWQTKVGKQNLYFALNTFADAGTVIQKINIDENKIPADEKALYFDFREKNDKLHPSVGAGLRIALNENFILAVDYGFATSKSDGLRGLYINIGNLF
jgi:outer membrane protein assembly factor BamA